MCPPSRLLPDPHQPFIARKAHASAKALVAPQAARLRATHRCQSLHAHTRSRRASRSGSQQWLQGYKPEGAVIVAWTQPEPSAPCSSVCLHRARSPSCVSDDVVISHGCPAAHLPPSVRLWDSHLQLWEGRRRGVAEREAAGREAALCRCVRRAGGWACQRIRL